MTFNVWTFLFEVVNFLVLAFILQRVLYHPLRQAIEKRKAENESARTAAEEARKAAEATREQLDAERAETDRKRQEILRQAAEQAETEAAKKIAIAEAAAKTTREQAAHDAQQLRADLVTELQGELGQQAISLAERILTQASDTSLQTQLIHHLIASIREIGDHERDQIRQQTLADGPVLECAAPIDSALQQELLVVINALLGRVCSLKIETNPALIGGAILRLGGHVWDATIAAQLEAARAAVGRVSR